MKYVLIVFVILGFTAVTFANENMILLPTSRFDSIDFSDELWNSLKIDEKLKGLVSDLIKYKDVKKAIVFRVNISLPIGGLGYYIRSSLEASAQFYTGKFPGWETAYRYPWLTVLLETTDGSFVLLNTYSDFSIIEYNGRCGMIINK